jgi:hypothetical protein
MTPRRKLEPCPQHAGQKPPAKLLYLLRTCPECMKWLGQHPRDAGLVTRGVPGTGPYRPRQSALTGIY